MFKKEKSGFIGKKHSEETKRIMSESRRGKKHPFYGKHHSKETKENISKALKGRKLEELHSKEKVEEIRNKIKEARAKQIFPIKDTLIEVKIQNFLKQLGIEFFTHQRMNIKHSYQCDILIPSKNLVIECDGDYWHNYPTGTDIDHIRTSELLKSGFRVLRLWEFEIKDMELNYFKEKIR